jgi:membrane-bound metal-dependent hydrolase YbcI (DUF457 family)
VNLPLLFVASIIPDVDLLIPGLEHRGPTHSLIVYGLLLIPALLLYGRKVAPYFVALAQHSLIGDFVTGGAQLLWPLTSANLYAIGIQITSLTNITLEWVLFLASFLIMQKAKEVSTLFQSHPSNLLLSIPTFTVLLPTLLRFPMYVPLALIIPHLVYLTIFTLSILIDFKSILKKS